MAKNEIKEGDKLPAFKIKDDAGKEVSIKDFIGKPMVIYFYPKDDTPGCTKEACDFRDNFARVKKTGAVVFGVSKDSVERHVKFKKKYDLPFPLLSDDTGEVCDKFGVWIEKSMYGRKYMGIERATFIVDKQGRIAKAFRKVKVPGHVDEVLECLKSL